METLTIGGIITNGIQQGLKNMIPVLVNTLLWVVTIWIPYLNVGTTIGMFAGVVAKMSRGQEIGMTEIFDPIYRKRMGEYFLVMGFTLVGVYVGMLFVLVRES